MSNIKVLSGTAMKTSMDVLIRSSSRRAAQGLVRLRTVAAHRQAGGRRQANDVAIVTDKAVDDLVSQGGSSRHARQPRRSAISSRCSGLDEA